MKLLWVYLLVYLGFLFLGGCGTLPQMVPLNRNLNPKEVKYVQEAQKSKRTSMFGRIFCRHQANYRAYALPPFCHYSQTVMVMENQEIYGAKSFSAPMIFANLAGISVLKAATFEPDGDLLQRGLAWNLAPVMKYARSYEYERDPAGQKVWYIGLVLDIFGYGRTGQGWFAKVGLPFGPAANDDKAMGLMMFFY